MLLSVNLHFSLNILIDSYGHGRIGDFGFSWELPDISGTRSLFSTKGFTVSKGYHGDELTCGHSSPKSDVYSYGVVSQNNVRIVW